MHRNCDTRSRTPCRPPWSATFREARVDANLIGDTVDSFSAHLVVLQHCRHHGPRTTPANRDILFLGEVAESAAGELPDDSNYTENQSAPLSFGVDFRVRSNLTRVNEERNLFNKLLDRFILDPTHQMPKLIHSVDRWSTWSHSNIPSDGLRYFFALSNTQMKGKTK
jgi:hypothetical protein